MLSNPHILVSENSRISGKYYFALFILWPFLSFLLALINYHQKESRKVVYFFLIYYGLNFVIANIWVDANRYALALERNALLPFSDFFEIVGGIYASDTSVDFLEPFISFFVSRFTNNSMYLFASFAAIFGFFYLKSINLLYINYKKNPGLDSQIHLIFFIFILPITAINGFRMWTAAWIFFYGAYRIIVLQEKRFIFVSLASCLVHWSFLSANLILIIYLIAGNRNRIYFVLVIVSFILPNLLTSIFQGFALRLGGAFESRFDMYTDELYVRRVQESLNETDWFLVIGQDLVLYYLLLAMIILHFRARNYEIDKQEKNLYGFSLLFLSFVNFGKVIPSFGIRFQVVFFLFSTTYICLTFLKTEQKKFSLITLLGIFPMLLYAAIVFRQGADSINAWIFAPGFGLPFFLQDISFADLFF